MNTKKAKKKTTGNTKKAKATKRPTGNAKKAKAAKRTTGNTKGTKGNTKEAKVTKRAKGNTKGAKVTKRAKGNTKEAKVTKRAKGNTKKAKETKRTTGAKKSTKEPSRMQAVGTAIRGTIASAVAAVSGGGSSRPDAIALLEADHRLMENLLKRGEESTENAVQSRLELLDRLTRELSMHEMIEEQILYPALQRHPEAKEIVLEGFQEHHVADLIVRELHEVAADDEQWGAKFKVLKENIEHHIQEEEGEMFRTARGIFSQDELQAMGEEMAAMKAQALPD